MNYTKPRAWRPPTSFGRISPPVREADVTKQVIDFLEARGWRPVRMQVGGRRSFRFGEKGMADWLCTRYRTGEKFHGVFWLELKTATGKLRPGQLEWIEAERAKGALVCVADSLESFQGWYEEVYG